MADFERNNALEWSLDAPAEGERPSSTAVGPAISSIVTTMTKQRRAQPTLIREPLSEAEAAWRRGDPSLKHISIPDQLALQERNALNNIARNAGAYIFAPSSRAVNGIIIFQVWGSEAAAATVEEFINSCTETSEERPAPVVTTDKSKKWVRVRPLTPALRARAEKKFERETKMETYRQHPEPGLKFSAIGSFLWPVQEYRPAEVLGKAYEALDPIRVDTRCYIVFRAERVCFEIMSRSKDLERGCQNVQDALLRLRATCFQIAARQIVPIKAFLLQWKEADLGHVPSHVKLEVYHHPQPITSTSPGRIGKSLRSQGSNTDSGALQLAEHLPFINAKKLRESIMTLLGKLRYFRGSVLMRIRLGEVALCPFNMSSSDININGRYVHCRAAEEASLG